METQKHQNHVLKQKLLQKFISVRQATEDLCAPLEPEDYVVSATPDTSPPKWHLAHSTWFFENFVLKVLHTDYQPYKEEFNFLFNSYYKRLGHFLAKDKRSVLSRPSVSEIMKYRHAITDTIIDEVAALVPEEFLKIKESFELGINHEQQHQELLLMDIKRNFFENPIRPKYHAEEHLHEAHTIEPKWHNIPSGLIKVGIAKSSEVFAFDNEKDLHSQWIESFMLSSHLVTNGEYLAFIEEGGYDNPLLWLSDGWEIKEKEKWAHPLYWEKEGKSWWVMTLAGMLPLDLSAPVVHVSFYEAMAFAKWKGCRLPTEYEWEAAAGMEQSMDAFMERGMYEPTPSNEDHELFSQIHGSVWEWTQSAYLPYPRYEKFHHGLSEYNEKFMCNQFVLKGGSCVTPKSHYRITYRNFYYPNMRWQFAGIRLAKDLA